MADAMMTTMKSKVNHRRPNIHLWKYDDFVFWTLQMRRIQNRNLRNDIWMSSLAAVKSTKPNALFVDHFHAKFEKIVSSNSNRLRNKLALKSINTKAKWFIRWLTKDEVVIRSVENFKSILPLIELISDISKWRAQKKNFQQWSTMVATKPRTENKSERNCAQTKSAMTKESLLAGVAGRGDKINIIILLVSNKSSAPKCAAAHFEISPSFFPRNLWNGTKYCRSILYSLISDRAKFHLNVELANPRKR